MVTSCRRFGLPSRRWLDIPEPCPMTAALWAPGICASVTKGIRVWVAGSATNATGLFAESQARYQSVLRDASGFPLVARDRTPVALNLAAVTVAVLPSR